MYSITSAQILGFSGLLGEWSIKIEHDSAGKSLKYVADVQTHVQRFHVIHYIALHKETPVVVA
jgi:hypothetical protein